jgi:hypothetical protein
VADGTKFWVVWSPQGGPPTVRHASLAAATNEAHRLALQAPGSEFFVLEAIGVAQKVTVQWTELHEPEIPF